MSENGAAYAAANLAKRVSWLESEYLLHGDRHDPEVTPWMPYQPADFIGILWECMPEIAIEPPGFLSAEPSFLDVGCGPGTKMDIAKELFGFRAYGIEIDAAMAERARAGHAFHVVTGDALYADVDYGNYDVIWLYRPFRDADKELSLETRITKAMKPGAILAGGSWELDVPGLGWATIVDDTLTSPYGPGEIWRGAWQKPKTKAS